MARYIESAQNPLFLCGSLEQLLPDNSVARTVFFALEKLDFSSFDLMYRNDDTGRPAISPKRLLAAWILALLRGIDSSLALAKLCQTDVEFRWLLQDGRVEKSTLCFFRKHCQDRLQKISLEILSALGKGGLLPASQLGMDGTVLRAAASCHQFKSKKQLLKRRKKLQEKIEQQLQQVDTEPKQSKDSCQQQQQKVEQALADMAALGLHKESDRLTLTAA